MYGSTGPLPKPNQEAHCPSPDSVLRQKSSQKLLTLIKALPPQAAVEPCGGYLLLLQYLGRRLKAKVAQHHSM